MEKSLKEIYKDFESKVTLDNILSTKEQTELEKASSDERLQVIVKNIANLAKMSGVPVQALSGSSNKFELKKDKKDNIKLKRLSKIENLAKKVNKEYEDKFPDAQKDGKNDKWHVHIDETKEFVNKLKSEPDKNKRIAIAKDFILPQMKAQGLSDEQINKPISHCYHNGALVTFQGGSIPLIDFISRHFVEYIMQRCDKEYLNKNESDFVTNNKKQNNLNKQKPENKENDPISHSADAINDMAAGGDSHSLEQKENKRTEIKDNKPKSIEEMTPEEQINYLRELGMDSMLPPSLRND